MKVPEWKELDLHEAEAPAKGPLELMHQEAQTTPEQTSETFTTKDSGKREEFDSGMVRDTQEGKPRYDLIPVGPLKRLADLYARGAIKYSDDNWKKGQPYSRAYASLFRHLIAWRSGATDEDHLAAVCFNAMALMFYEDNRPEFDDLFKEKP